MTTTLEDCDTTMEDCDNENEEEDKAVAPCHRPIPTMVWMEISAKFYHCSDPDKLKPI